jgi:hypothetical protein
MMSMGFSYAQVHLQQEQCKERIKRGDQILKSTNKREEKKTHRGKVHPTKTTIHFCEEA